LGLDDTTEWALTCYEILAGGLVVLAAAYVIWFFVDYAGSE
jgi:hypothetical protein